MQKFNFPIQVESVVLPLTDGSSNLKSFKFKETGYTFNGKHACQNVSDKRLLFSEKCLQRNKSFLSIKREPFSNSLDL